MATGQRYERTLGGKIWRRFERSTGETVQVSAPIVLFEDFVNGEATAANSTTGSRLGFTQFTYVLHGATTSDSASFTPAVGSHGICDLLAAADNTTVGWSGLTNEDVEAFDIGATTTQKGLNMEVRAAYTVATTMAEKNVFIGFAAGAIPNSGTGILTLNTVVGFFIGSTTSTGLPSTSNNLSIYTASVNGASSPVVTGPTDSGLDATTAVQAIYRIDTTDKANVKFYVDGNRVNSGTTYDISAITAGANQLVQPVIIMNRSASVGATAGTLSLDYVKIWSAR